MRKRNLSQGQQRRVEANHQRRLTADKNTLDLTIEHSDLAVIPGVVISRFGKQADVEQKDGQIYRCHIRRTVPNVVTGDKVLWSLEPDGKKGIITAVQQRTSLISRPDMYDGIKPIAANIDTLFIVSALYPELSLNIIDRYLVIAETTDIPVVIIFNKIDLLNSENVILLERAEAIYNAIGYNTVRVSSTTETGMAELQQKIVNKTIILTGQSGVGKSSILNTLLPDANILTNTVSSNSGLGQHTTTASRLYHSPLGGNIIDSPGIREFGLWHLEKEQITAGFTEFDAYRGACKFRDCLHTEKDPDCAITQAVKQGKIAVERFENYHRLIESLNKNNLKKNFHL